MESKYPTKVDWWLAAIIIASVVSPPLLGFITAPNPDAGAVVVRATLAVVGVELVVFALLVWPIHYVLDADRLRVRSGLLLRWTVPYQDISQVYPTNNPLSSPAWSLDRIQIDKLSGGALLISPTDQDRFLSELAMRAGLTRSGSRLVRGSDTGFGQSQS